MGVVTMRRAHRGAGAVDWPAGGSMLEKRFSLTTMDVLTLLAALVLLAGLNVWQLVGPAVIEARANTLVRPPSGQRMPDEMQLWYDRWNKRATDVSVFARGQTAFGWVTGYLDEDLAKSTALAWCMENDDDCRIVEVRNTLSKIEGLDVQITTRAKPVFDRFQMTSGPVAFAVSGSGAYASRKGETAERARANALSVCTRHATKDRKAFLPTNPCRVIAER